MRASESFVKMIKLFYAFNELLFQQCLITITFNCYYNVVLNASYQSEFVYF